MAVTINDGHSYRKQNNMESAASISRIRKRPLKCPLIAVRVVPAGIGNSDPRFGSQDLSSFKLTSAVLFSLRVGYFE